MKKLYKETKFHYALLVSTGLHLIFMLIFGIISLRSIEEEIDPGIQVEIISTPPRHTLRLRRRPMYTPPASKVIVPKAQKVNSETVRTVQTIRPPASTTYRNPLERKPLSILSEESAPLANSADTIGDTNLHAADTEGYEGLIAGGASSPLGQRSTHKQRFLTVETPDFPPEIDGLTQSDVALTKIARHILSTRTSDQVDIIFVIDASQSMRNDIDAVRDHLSQMTDLFKAEKLDFMVGVVAFRSSAGYALLGWDFEVTPQTNSVDSIKRVLSRIRCRGGEKTLNALVKSANKIQFRKNAERRFILVTDEYVSGEYSAKEVLMKMEMEKIHVDVIGRDEHFQKLLAQQSGGIWLPIASLKN